MVQIWNNYILFPDSVKKYIGSEFRVFWIRIKIFGWIRIQLNMDSKHCCSLPFSSISFTDHDVEEGFVYFSQITYQIFVTVFFFKLLILFGLKWFWSCLKKNVHFVYRHFISKQFEISSKFCLFLCTLHCRHCLWSMNHKPVFSFS